MANAGTHTDILILSLIVLQSMLHYHELRYLLCLTPINIIIIIVLLLVIRLIQIIIMIMTIHYHL